VLAQADGAGAAGVFRTTNPTDAHVAVTVSSAGKGAGLNASSAKGIGAVFTGAAAPIRLLPRGGAGAPATGSHLRGEISVDNAGDVFVCTAAGTPGTWRQVAFV
jgi:hypothetical protein